MNSMTWNSPGTAYSSLNPFKTFRPPFLKTLVGTLALSHLAVKPPPPTTLWVHMVRPRHASKVGLGLPQPIGLPDSPCARITLTPEAPFATRAQHCYPYIRPRSDALAREALAASNLPTCLGGRQDTLDLAAAHLETARA